MAPPNVCRSCSRTERQQRIHNEEDRILNAILDEVIDMLANGVVGGGVVERQRKERLRRLVTEFSQVGEAQDEVEEAVSRLLRLERQLGSNS